jgi:signal transduction histidine kinase
MSALELIQILSNGLFLLVFLAVFVRAVRHPRRANIDAAVFFGALGAVVGLSLVSRMLGITMPPAVGVVLVVVLLALPLLTLRLVGNLVRLPALVIRSCLAGWVVASAAFAFLPREALAPITLPIVLYFFGYEAYAGVVVLRATRRASGATRNRLYAVALGSLLLGATLLVAGLVGRVPQIAFLTNVVGLAAGLAYFVGFSTPLFLRRAWQEPHLRGFMARATELTSEQDVATVARGLAAVAGSVLGADLAAVGLWDDRKQMLRYYATDGRVDEALPANTASGPAFAEQRPVLRIDGDGGLPFPERLRGAGMRSALGAPVTWKATRYGVLGTYSTRVPLFAEDDLEIVQILAGQIALVLRAHDLIAEVRALNTELEHRVSELDSANDELTAFSYAVSHDLRAPLRAIDGFSEVLVEEKAAALGEDGREHLGRVRKAAQNMGHLIDDLLELSRVTRAELRRQPVDLSALARDVAAEHAAQTPDRAVTFKAEDGLRVEGDDRLLRVVLVNLIGNAWKFTRPVKEPRVELGLARQNGTSAFFVRDNGVGFEMQYRQKLFTPFQRLHSPRDFEGTGIGLATVRRVIRRHGGDVWAESEPGRGATFYFTLPA